MQKCKKEERLLKIRRAMGEDVKPFTRMNDEQFTRIMNTLFALNSMKHKRRDVTPIIPTNADVLELMLVMKENANASLEIAYNFYEGEQQKNLVNELKKELACAEHYIQLALDNFFANNEENIEKTELEQL